jgi:hypothetical protein
MQDYYTNEIEPSGKPGNDVSSDKSLTLINPEQAVLRTTTGWGDWPMDVN